jgi:hypothetical protein
MGPEHRFEVRNGEFLLEIPGIRPRVSADRLALFAASATDEFRPVYDFLTTMRFYSIAPLRIRELQDPDPGDYLKRDGGNAAAVLKRLREKNVERYERACRLLAKVGQGIRKVEYRAIAQEETLQYKQYVGLKDPWTFDALNMSDGTLRALGVLLAAYQPGLHSVIVIEEPAATVHRAVTELIVGVLLDTAHERQVLLTTHSPDILDHKERLAGRTDSDRHHGGRPNADLCPLGCQSRSHPQTSLHPRGTTAFGGAKPRPGCGSGVCGTV